MEYEQTPEGERIRFAPCPSRCDGPGTPRHVWHRLRELGAKPSPLMAEIFARLGKGAQA